MQLVLHKETDLGLAGLLLVTDGTEPSLARAVQHPLQPLPVQHTTTKHNSAGQGQELEALLKAVAQAPRGTSGASESTGTTTMTLLGMR